MPKQAAPLCQDKVLLDDAAARAEKGWLALFSAFVDGFREGVVHVQQWPAGPGVAMRSGMASGGDCCR